MILAHAKDGSPAWHQWYKSAFFEGFKKLGLEFGVTPADRIESSNLEDDHILFGPNYFPHVFRSCDPANMLLVNRCFFGKVEDWVALSWSGFNGDGVYAKWTPDDAAVRFDKWGSELPNRDWRGEGSDYAVIIGEYPSVCDDKVGIVKWYAEAVDWCNANGITPVFRPHPSANFPLKWCKNDRKADVTRAAMVLTHSSTFGVECRLRGIPTIATNHSVASFSPEADDNFIYDVLFTQWHIDEIRDGTFWEYVNNARS